MQYEEIAPLPRSVLLLRLESGSSDEIAHALVSAAFHEPDWTWVQDWCIRLVDHSDGNVQRVAITCLGHLARIHHTLDLGRVLPLLHVKIEGNELRGTVEDALSDIRIFIPVH